MTLKKWDDLPKNIKNEKVLYHYNLLNRRRSSLVFKRIFDLVLSVVITLILVPIFIIVSIAIKSDSKGSIMYRQVRITQYGKKFKIFKFRTMVVDADKIGTQVTINNDPRVTKIGRFLRKYKLDEIPQLLNIIIGDMSFVGTRPEVIKYVEKYTDEMMATLLLRAGVTSKASIMYKDEEKQLENSHNADNTYLNEILPIKMKYNLKSIDDYSFWNEIKIMIDTIIQVAKK